MSSTRPTSLVLDIPGEDLGAHLLDRAYIEELATHLGAELATELLADGMIAVSDRLARLAANQDASLQEVARMAHDLTGAAGQIGLHALCAAARRLEHLALSQRVAEVPGAMGQVLSLGTASIDALGLRLAGDH
ncbi:MAG: Hpt domain-containing protein [Pseudomonadota bacterium]